MLKWICALASGLLFFVGWGSSSLAVLFLGIFLCPLLIAEHYLTQSNLVKIILGYSTFLLFHLLAGKNLITNIGSSFLVFLLISNSLALLIPWIMYILLKRKINLFPSLILFTLTWLTAEQFSFIVDIPSPWFILGNGLCAQPQLIQFYEYSGVLGGSLWVLLFNCALFYSIVAAWTQNNLAQKIIQLVFVLLAATLPLVLSKLSKFDLDLNKGKTEEALILNTFQSSADILGVSLSQLLKVTKGHMTNKTRYIVWPENTFASIIPENRIEKSQLVRSIRSYLVMSDSTELICGAILSSDNNKFFNSALIINSTDISVYKKRKLVPVTEQYPILFELFQVFKLFDIEFTEGPNEISTSEISINICYETLFGELVADNSYKSSGKLLAFISNEYWTQGASEFLVGIASIRAIENRKFVLRSTNNGVGSIIDPAGNVLLASKNEAVDSITAQVARNNYMTFYMQNRFIINMMPLMLLALSLIIVYYSNNSI